MRSKFVLTTALLAGAARYRRERRRLPSARRSLVATAAALAILAGPPAAHAGETLIGNRAAWTGAVSSPTTLDFNQVTGSNRTVEGASFADGGVNFSVPAHNDIYDVGPTFLGFAAGTFYGNGYLHWNAPPSCFSNCTQPNTLTVTLPHPVNAIAFDYAEISGNALGPDILTIVVDGQTFSKETSSTGALFFGLTDTNTFTSFTITDLNTPSILLDPTIDNLSFASPQTDTAVPEPGPIFLLCTGIVALSLLRRRACGQTERTAPRIGVRGRFPFQPYLRGASAMTMAIRTALNAALILGGVASIAGLPRPAHAGPSDFLLLQESGTTINMFDSLSPAIPVFSCAESQPSCFVITIGTPGGATFSTAAQSFNVYDDAAHTVLSDTISTFVNTQDQDVLIVFRSGDSLTPLEGAAALTETGGIQTVYTLSDPTQIPTIIEFQSSDLPEPSSLLLLAVPLAGLALRRGGSVVRQAPCSA